MPCLQVLVNISLTPAQKQDATAALSKLVAQLTGKPEGYVQVLITDGVAILFAGSPGNSAFLDFRSIGAISNRQNKATSAALTKYLTDNLAIPGNRIYISFTNAAGENWGYNGGTFG
jgi:phenylpyruvate tautomerase PptA (4-oxalocrotonate tautomerase family)